MTKQALPAESYNNIGTPHRLSVGGISSGMKNPIIKSFAFVAALSLPGSLFAMPTPYGASVKELEAISKSRELAERFNALDHIETITRLPQSESNDDIGGLYRVIAGPCSATVQMRWVSDGATVPGKLLTEISQFRCD
jgi:hypothetical protein